MLMHSDIQIGCRIEHDQDHFNDSYDSAGEPQQSQLIYEVSFYVKPNIRALLLSKEDCASFFENDHYLNLCRQLCLLLGGNLSIDRAEHGRFSFLIKLACEVATNQCVEGAKVAVSCYRSIVLVNLRPETKIDLQVLLKELGVHTGVNSVTSST